jgi:hypothetical protein
MSQLMSSNFVQFHNLNSDYLENYSHFLVSWECACCAEGKRSSENSWFNFKTLVEEFQVSDAKLKQMEQEAIKELRQFETKRHA